MRRFLLVTMAICLFAMTAFAQSNTGNLVGTVSDASGVIPGATVVVKDNQTGKERTVIAGGDGSFSVSQLDVGTYTVTVSAAGHKGYSATDVKINIAQTYSLNPLLEVGDISETVTVVGGVDLVNSTSGELSTTVSQRQIVELPLNGRNPLSLVLLQAGTSSNSAQNTTINGQRSSFTNITRDGLNVQDNFIRANAVDFIPDRPNVDDTGEFTIVTSNAGAESGYGASQIQLVTPRGSNDFHGAIYLYNRNSHFAANRYFSNASNQARTFLNRNQFGGKVGGPIIKNKVFFFAAYEGFRLRQSTATTRTILLPNARAGLFTYRDTTLASMGGSVVRTVNLLGGAFGALTGITAIDPTVNTRILSRLPTAGNTNLGDGLNTTGFAFGRLNNTDREAFKTRIDYDISQNSSINGVYAYNKENLLRPDVDLQPGGAATAGFNTTPDGFQFAHTKFLALAWRWAPTANLTNEVRGGFQTSDPTFDRNNPITDYFLSIPLISNTESAFQTQGRFTKYYNAQDNAVWTKGAHTFRLGGSLQLFKINPFGPGAAGNSTIPTYTLGGGTVPVFSVASFNTAAGCVAATGANCISSVTTANSLLALLGGLVGSGNLTFNATTPTSGYVPNAQPNRNLSYNHTSLYFTDQWRATQRLTLNLGLRYELFSPIREDNGLAIEAVIPNGTSNIRQVILDPLGTYNFVGTNFGDGKFFTTDKNNFAPILSFAYSPTFKNGLLNMLFPGEGRTVFRGGFRMSYVNDEFVRAADNALIGNQGTSQQVVRSGLNGRLTAPPTFTTPVFGLPRTFAANNTLAANFGTVFAIDPDLQVPRTTEYNIGIERELGFQTAVEIRYVHGESKNLVRGLDLNQVNLYPAFIADFRRAQSNLVTFGSINPATCPTTPGCQPLQVLNMAPFSTSGILTNGTILTNIRQGEAGQFAFNAISGFGAAVGAPFSTLFLANPNTGVVDLIGNFAKYRYNSLQIEFRRRFTAGLSFQANYTFQKTLTDAPGTGQTRFEPLIDNASPQSEYARADYDTAHVLNLNAIYELPFGRGKKFGGDVGRWTDRVIGGWQLTSIVRLSTGAPFSITDARGTFNRAGRSGRQTAISSLTRDQIRNLVGIFRTPCGVYYIDPAVINIDLTTCGPRVGSGTGQAHVFGQAAFPGQVFFPVPAGQTGNIEPGFINGPMYLQWDASLIKNIPITERVRFQLRAEAFNVLNRANFSPAGQFTLFNITSSTFGRLTSTFDPRIIQFVGRLEF